MGHYHKNLPDNVQKDKTRKRCYFCNKRRFIKNMERITIYWDANIWICQGKHKTEIAKSK